MRTTLTLDDDVAALIRTLQEQTGKSLKEVVNAALREGLPRLAHKPKRKRRVRIEPLPVSGPRVPSLDNIAEVLAYAEGDDFR